MKPLTRSQQIIYDILSDGRAHPRQDMIEAMPDELFCGHTLTVHMSNLRSKLRPIGQDVVCTRVGNASSYSLVRTLSNPNRG